MAAYNIAACCFRRDNHLRVNALVYTLAVAYEVKQTLHHLKYITSAAATSPPTVLAETPPTVRSEAKCA